MIEFFWAASALLFLLALMVIDHKTKQPFRCRICGGLTDEERKRRCRGLCEL